MPRFVEIRESEKEIMEIAYAASERLISEHKMNIQDAEIIPTVTYCFLREAMDYLNQKKAPGKTVAINLLQLFDIGVSYRENDEAEKEGNYTPFLVAGQEFKTLIKSDEETEIED